MFDRSLDGARIEDTVDDMEVPKANPPISAGWPDSDTVMSDPPFSAAVLYNSLPDWGPDTTYAFLTPRPAGFPAATAVTFTLDPNGLTSVYGEPMDGPTAITVNTGPFTVSLPNGTGTVPTSYRVPMAFSTRAPRDQTLTPFIHVLAGVTPLPFDLKNDNGDTTLIYIIPTPTGCSGWPAATEITIFADQGLPDAFGKPLAMPVAGRFVTSSIGSCGGTDGGASDAAMADAGADAATQTTAARPTCRRTDGGTDDGAARRRASVELTREHVRERVAHSLLHRRHVDGPPELARHRAHHGRVQPARVDRREAPEIGRDVQREPVQGHPALHRDADRRQLALGGGVPHAGPPVLARPRADRSPRGSG